MNSKTTLLLVSILSFALLANVNNVGSVFATGGLDDEEEEEAIEELQTAVSEINSSLEAINLNLTSGPNNIQANCPDVEEIVQEVVENITEIQPPQPQPQQNITEPSCPVVSEPEPIVNQTVLPPVEAAQPEPEPVPEQNNETQACQPIPEPVKNETQQQQELEPIICPLNGNLLGYTNTTSGEQLPISAVEEQNNGTIPFLPPIELPVEPEPGEVQTNQTVTITPEQPTCENVTETQQPIAPTITNNGTIQDEQEIASIEFEATCGCFVVDKSPEEVGSNGGGEVGIGNPEEIEQGLYY